MMITGILAGYFHFSSSSFYSCVILVALNALKNGGVSLNVPLSCYTSIETRVHVPGWWGSLIAQGPTPLQTF